MKVEMLKIRKLRLSNRQCQGSPKRSPLQVVCLTPDYAEIVICHKYRNLPFASQKNPLLTSGSTWWIMEASDWPKLDLIFPMNIHGSVETIRRPRYGNFRQVLVSNINEPQPINFLYRTRKSTYLELVTSAYWFQVTNGWSICCCNS